MDCSLPGSSVHGIFQARVLEWGAIAFSDIYTYIYIYASQVVAPSARDTGSIPGGWEDALEKGWQPTPLFLPRKPHGQRSLAGYSPGGSQE